MELVEYIDEPTVAALRRLWPETHFEPVLTPILGSLEPCVSLDLPSAPEAEYSFLLMFRPEKQIHARLIGCDGGSYFWYMPFEDAAFKNSVEELDKAFIKTLELLALHDTRIVQKRGLLWHSFRCDYKADTGWQRVYAMAALRVGRFNPPRISGRQRVYLSPATLSNQRVRPR